MSKIRKNYFFVAGRKKLTTLVKSKRKWRNLHILHLSCEKLFFFVTENRGPLYKLFGDPLSVFDATIDGARENFSVFGTTAYDVIILKL